MYKVYDILNKKKYMKRNFNVLVFWVLMVLRVDIVVFWLKLLLGDRNCLNLFILLLLFVFFMFICLEMDVSLFLVNKGLKVEFFREDGIWENVLFVRVCMKVFGVEW